ncbi:nose resistant to fluoxetine protein 6-like [Plakobranchus ocellatus]|uniref:Nose resistant to fluoxetine protein 6-like n=1 Tax=Plakobranchus ocellatus TaxID=259542 RepID=A0AAV4D5Q2_9GAST|nr:nose resistant to fluoxetine protein 6-like [Plakobranchus ocellatus]
MAGSCCVGRCLLVLTVFTSPSFIAPSQIQTEAALQTNNSNGYDPTISSTVSSAMTAAGPGDIVTAAETAASINVLPSLESIPGTTQPPDSSASTAASTRKIMQMATNPGSSSPSSSSISAKTWQLLQQLATLLPELREMIGRSQPPTLQQVSLLLDLVRQVGAGLSALPSRLQEGNSSSVDLATVLSKSGLMRNLTASQNPSQHATGVLSDNQPYTVNWLKCEADLLHLSNGLMGRQLWAMQMIDSWGKPESSILRGNLLFLGNNDECRNVHHQNATTFANVQGNICRIKIYLDFMKGLMFDDPGPASVTMDVCMPKSCQSVDIIKALNESGISNVFVTCTADLDIGEDHWAIIAIIILALLLALIVAGTVTEFCVGFKTQNRSEFISACIKSDYDKDIDPLSDTSKVATSGEMDKAERNESRDFLEMTDLRHNAGGTDVRQRLSSGTANSFRKMDSNGRLITNYDVYSSKSFICEVGGGEKSHIHDVDISNGPPRFPPVGKSASNKILWTGPSSGQVKCEDSPPLMRQAKEKQDEGSRTASMEDIAHLAKWQKLFLAFSLPRNTGKILSVKPGAGTIGCLHGIRVLSMGWVILGHVIIFGAGSNSFKNRSDIYDLIQTFMFQIIANAPLSVDTFFFMSGLLTAYLFLKECGKNEKVTIKQGILYYVHRYWRLTPPMLIWILVVSCLLQYIGEGRPGWTDYPAALVCRDSWWVNLLYIQNLYIEKLGCMGVTWYLANDMQFYILAPLVRIPWVYRQAI